MDPMPKIFRHRQGHTESRHIRNELQATNTSSTADTKSPTHANGENILHVEEGTCAGRVEESDALLAAVATRLLKEHERNTSNEDNTETMGCLSSSQTSHSQQTVLLVNGYAPQQNANLKIPHSPHNYNCSEMYENNDLIKPSETDASELAAAVPPEGVSSSRNSSGDAMSLRETLQQLPPSVSTYRHRRTLSPHSPSRRIHETAADASFARGILSFMDREFKQSSPTPSALSAGSVGRKHQSLSDPTASPAQRSIRSRSSLEKSPRRKRSKSESRRRRERKLIAAGEMEVRQANETLMRYLKQCSEMNDASLSGELEIDQSLEDRKVHRKTKSQRDKRGHIISKFYTASGLTSILKDLSDDIVPADGDEIYNPFTPVVSPTDDTPAHIDKIFMQTSSGYRPVEHYCYYGKRSLMHSGAMSGRILGGHSTNEVINNSGIIGGSSVMSGSGGSGRHTSSGDGSGAARDDGGKGFGMHTSCSYGDSRVLLDDGCYRPEITHNIHLACLIQRIWLLISNICHGLLAGLALAHLLLIFSGHTLEWSNALNNPESETTALDAIPTTSTQTIITIKMDTSEIVAPVGLPTIRFEYATFAHYYINTFYCLTVISMVSVLDRMDICRWNLSNASELISFRWLIITMIYTATIILTICSDNMDIKLYYSNSDNLTLTHNKMINNSVISIWSSLSVTRSIGAICGWILIGLTPHEDLFYEHLLHLTRYQMTNN